MTISRDLVAAYEASGHHSDSARLKAFSMAVLEVVLAAEHLAQAAREPLERALDAWRARPPNADVIEDVADWVKQYAEAKHGDWLTLVDMEDSVLRAATVGLHADIAPVDVGEAARWVEDYVLGRVGPCWTPNNPPPLLVRLRVPILGRPRLRARPR